MLSNPARVDLAIKPHALLLVRERARTVEQVREISAEHALLAARLSDGSVLPFRHQYKVSYPGDRRVITPELEYPWGEAPIAFGAAAARDFAAREEDGELLLAAVDANNVVSLKTLTKTESLLGDTTVEEGAALSFTPAVSADLLLVEASRAERSLTRGETSVSFRRRDRRMAFATRFEMTC